MSDKQIGVPSRAQILKKLREAHADTVERTQVLVREQRQLHQSICQFIQDSPKTIPQIAAEIGKPSNEVLWYVSVMKKYGIVVEAGMCGDYPLYLRVKESEA